MTEPVVLKKEIVRPLFNDIRSVLRGRLKRRRLSSVAVMTLAFGIGAGSILLTLVHVLSPSLSKRTGLMAFDDATRERISNEDSSARRWDEFSFPVRPYVDGESSQVWSSIPERLTKRNRIAESRGLIIEPMDPKATEY